MKRIDSLFILFVSLVIISSGCNAQKPLNKNSLDSFIRKKADSLYNSSKVPGITIAILNNGERNYYNFGFADKEKKTVFDSTTLFEIGSITKTFTAYALEAVLKEKEISDTGSVIQYLPDSVQLNKLLAPITFVSLMNHTSGLPRLPDNMPLSEDNKTPYDTYTSNDLFTYLQKCVPKPDGKSNYSNLGAGLAGVLAERIAGKSYAALLDKYIFLPFKIVTPDKSIVKTEKSQGYFENDKTPYWNMDVLAPAGGLKCSGNEMLTYLQAMSIPVNLESKELIDKLLVPTISINTQINVCRAWHTLEQKDKPIIYWHNGGTYGFSTFAAFIKGENKAVIVAVNQFNKNAISDALGIAIIKKLTAEE